MSLRARLLLVLGVLLATYAATAVAIVSTQRSLLIDQVDQRLAALPPLEVSGGTTVPLPEGELPQPAPGAVDRAPASSLSELYVGVVDADGRVAPQLIGAFLTSTPDIEAAVEATGGEVGTVTVRSVDTSARFRAHVIPQVGGATWLVAAHPLAETDAAIDRLERTFAIAGGVIVTVLGIATLWIQRLGLRPIACITAAAEAIASGERFARVEVTDRGTEASKLGRAFNVMLDERDADEARLRQFVADASHELRTPLTSVRGYLELYRQGAFREQAQLDDVVRRLSAEAARMHALVEDLLALAKLDESRPLRQETVDLGQILRDAAQDARAVQPNRPIEVQVPAEGPRVVGDAALLMQLVGILIANVLAHTPVIAAMTLSAGDDDDGAVISVADRGQGLDLEAAAHVFDRFWRGDASRNRYRGSGHTDGAGLGLAIARAITTAHGGTIELETAPGEGCVFSVRLPRDGIRSRGRE